MLFLINYLSILTPKPENRELLMRWDFRLGYNPVGVTTCATCILLAKVACNQGALAPWGTFKDAVGCLKILRMIIVQTPTP